MIEFIQDILDLLLEKIKEFPSNFKAWLDKKSQENAEKRLKQTYEEAVIYLDRNYRDRIVREIAGLLNDRALLKDYKENPKIVVFNCERRGLGSYLEVVFKPGFHIVNNEKFIIEMLKKLTAIRLESAKLKFEEYRNINEPYEFYVSSRLYKERIHLKIIYKMVNA